MLVAACMFFGFGSNLRRRHQLLQEHWLLVTGRVTEVKSFIRNLGGRSRSIQVPVIEYSYGASRYRYEPQSGSNVALWRVGAEIDLRVDPSDPQRVELASGHQYVAFVLCLFGGGLACVGSWCVVGSGRGCAHEMVAHNGTGCLGCEIADASGRETAYSSRINQATWGADFRPIDRDLF